MNKYFVLTIRAQDLTDDPLMSDTSLNIRVIDVNDNKPTFNNINFPVGIIYVLVNKFKRGSSLSFYFCQKLNFL